MYDDDVLKTSKHHDLRTRIADVDEQHNQLIATLADGWKCSCGVKFGKALQMVVMREWRLHKADAVIEALDRDYVIVEPGTPLAQRIAHWQLLNWDGHWEGPPDD